jgi:hypothetical protein
VERERERNEEWHQQQHKIGKQKKE